MGADAEGAAGAPAGTTVGVPPPTPLPSGVAHHTGIALYKVAQFAQDLLDQALAPIGLRTRHFSVLAALTNAGPASQQALGAKLRVDRTTMVKTVDDLERLGLVERRRNVADRRFYDLTPTPAGRNAVAAAEVALAATEADLLAPLDAAQRAQLHELLGLLLARGRATE
jgi:DNA-binding MarR family transcriptional regulator